MKKLPAFLMTGVFLLTLCSCFPTGKETVASTDASISVELTDSDHVELTLAENLEVQADVHQNKNAALSKFQASLQEFDCNQILSSQFADKTITERSESKNGLYPDHTATFIHFDDDTSLTINLGEIRFTSPSYSDRPYNNEIFSTGSFIRPNLKQIYKNDHLETVDKSLAIQLVSDAIQTLGISASDTPEVIALDYDTMMSEWEDFQLRDGSWAAPWSENEEAYAIVYPVQYNGVNITDFGYWNSGKEVFALGSRILGVVSEQGLINLYCTGLYDQIEETESNVSCISLEAALTQIKKKYEDILLTDPITITNISLEYVPLATDSDSTVFEFVPAWVFDTKQVFNNEAENGKEASQYESNYSVVILAEDGQELKVGALA